MEILLLVTALLAFKPSTLAQSESNVDSLTQKLNSTNYDSTRIRLLIELGGVYESSIPSKALSYYEQALEIAESSKNEDRDSQENQIMCLRLIGIVYNNLNAFDKAMDFFMRSLRQSEELKFIPGMAAAMNNIGMVHESLRNYDLSIDYYNKSLQLSIQLGDTFGIARGYNNIGVTYSQLDKMHLAIANYKKAAEAFEKLGYKYHCAATYNNIGTYYLGLIHSTEGYDSTENYYQKSLYYLQKAMPIFREMNEQFDLATCLVNIAQVHLQLNKLLKDSQSVKDWHLQKAIEIANESLEISQRIKAYSTIYFAAYTLKDAYKKLEQCPRALEYAELVIDNNDSLFYMEKDRTIAEIEAIYQTDKQQQLIEQQNLKASRQKLLRNALIIGIALMILFATSTYLGYINKRKANRIISEKNNNLQLANAEIMAQRDELEDQRNMLMNQNFKLEEAHTQITDSLNYAQSIQAAILPSEKILKSISSNYFILMKPVQVVSGDFFWAVNFDEYQIFGVADCTGHGVPGAFMSILGLNALNDIIIRHRIITPNQILGLLRESVINALGQNDPDQTHKDGVDMALCTFNTKTRELQYSGARIPLWIVVDNDSGFIELPEKTVKTAVRHNNFSLFEIKSDFMPIGIAPRTIPFTPNTFSLKNCKTSIYLATDGFLDQFGGDETSKFGTVRLKNLILQNASKQFAEQKTEIEKEFNKWVGEGNQVDDVTILGISV